MGQADMCVVLLQNSKFFRAEVATDWMCDLLQCPGQVDCGSVLQMPLVHEFDDVILRCGTICKCAAAINTLIRDKLILAMGIRCRGCRSRVFWCAMNFFQLVKTSPHLPFSPDSFARRISRLPADRSGVIIVLSVRVVPERF